MDINQAIEDLDKIDRLVTLGILIGTEVTPLVTGAIRGIKRLQTDQGEQEYVIVIRMGKQELENAKVSFTNALVTVNEARTQAGLPPLDVPA